MRPLLISTSMGGLPFARFVFCRRIRATSVLVAVLVAILAIPRVSPGADVKGQVIEQDGKELAVLENDWIRLTVNPSQGGRVSSFIVKRTNREMITPGNCGLFMDHFFEQFWPGEFLGASYEMEVTDAGPEKAAVRVMYVSTGHWMGAVSASESKVRVTRTLTLPADRPVIQCDVELKNTDTATKIVTYWLQHYYRADGDAGPAPRQVCTIPTCRGVLNNAHGGFFRDPSAGWSAGVDPKDRIGLVFLMDYDDLQILYNCYNITVEYMYDKIILPGGMSWKTQTSALLVEGLESVVYASPRLVADMQVSTDGDALRIEHAFVAPAAPLPKAKVTTTLAWLNRNLAIGAQPSVGEVSGIGREPQRVKAEFPGMAGKPLIIQVNVEGDGWKESYEFPYAGTGTGKEPDKFVGGYTMPAPPKHPHIIKPPLLTKEKNEKPRILHLRGLYYGLWKVDEAAKTMGDNDIVVSWYKDTGMTQTLNPQPWDYNEIMKQDVIIFNNIAYGGMVGEQGAAMLRAYVENGGSALFLGGPQAFGSGGYEQSGELKELLPVTLTGPYDLRRLKAGTRLAVPRGSPLAGVKWGKQAPVAMWMHALAPKPDAAVWLRAGNQPAIVTKQVGKGRVAVVLLTPLGKPAKGQAPFWESPGWPRTMAALMRWLAVGG